MNQHRAPTVAQVFDLLASSYDQTGVEFFAPVGRKLVELLDAAPGDRCLDIGCGRGAVTLPLAAAVGPSGSVHGVDVSPGMLAEARSLASQSGLDNVTFEVGDAGDLGGLDANFSLIASSLVLFFLTDPAAALRGWVQRLAPGGRIGLVTFGDEDEASQAIEDLLTPYAPPGFRDPTLVEKESPFSSDAGMERLLAGAGARDVRTVMVPTVIEFADAQHWQHFSMSTGQRAMWMRMPEDDKPKVLARAEEILEPTRPAPDQPCRLEWQMRYTLGVS
ncbi:MAG: class I SAM-dependent methyltransferase [Marmoricola sp.]